MLLPLSLISEKYLRQRNYLQLKVHFEADDTNTHTAVPQRPFYLSREELKAQLYNLSNVTRSFVTGRSSFQSPRPTG